jgi:hypothetical protein
MFKKKINYAKSMSVHPLIADHPLYNSLFSSSLNKYEIVNDDLSSELTFIPTYYKNIQNNHSIIIEDYITLFFPHIHNGSNFEWDYNNCHWLNNYKQMFQNPNFKGVICHMKQTIDSIGTIFNNDETIKNKLFYLSLAYQSPIEVIKKTNKDKIILTFTNSFGGTENNFPLRGGVEVIIAFKNIIEKGYKNVFLNLLGDIKIDKSLNDWIISCPFINILPHDEINHGRKMYTDNTIHKILKDTDIFLIPACRIHSMSVVKALTYGNIVLGSDGWGFNEFLDEEFMCKGQYKSSYIENGVLKEKYSLHLESPNIELCNSIESKIIDLIENPSNMDLIKENNLINSKIKFSKEKRDLEFESIIDKMLN